MKKKIIIPYTAGIFALILLLVTVVSAGNPPVSMHIVADKKSYEASEPIKLEVNTVNISGADVIANEGFFNQDFYLEITFTDPDGQLIHTSYKNIGNDPGPPRKINNRKAVTAEIIPASASNYRMMNDAREFYELTKYGVYTAKITANLDTFSEYGTDSEGNVFGFLDDTGKESFSLLSNTISFEILPPVPGVKSSIETVVKLLKIGTGTKPPVSKKPLENVLVRLIRRSAVPADYYPINFKTYSLIWANVPPVRTSLTDSQGIAKFERITKDDYLIIALYDQSQDFRHMGSNIDSADPEWDDAEPVRKYLMVMEKADGKKSPGKTTKQKGSLLLITEPEYVEWDNTYELYPFVLESIGDWSVTATVNPPEGFVADHDTLSEDVNTELETLQFTITDIGSRWEETEVTYDILHKGKKKKIKSKIGVKLSKKLAKKKKLGIYGHTKSPGNYKGGKKHNR